VRLEMPSRAVVRVIGVSLPGGERSQDPGPRGGEDRGVPLQLPQALSLSRGRQLGGIGGGQVAQPGADHVQRLTGICRGRRAHLVTSTPGLAAASVVVVPGGQVSRI